MLIPKLEMFDLPLKFLEAVEVIRRQALVIALDRLSTGIAEIVTTGAGHMSASFCFLYNLTAFITLSVFFGHLELDCHFDLALSLVSDR